MRIRKKPWEAEELERAAGGILIENPAALRGRWAEYFGGSGPIHIEIGCGKGRFIVAHAERFPGVNYIAVEKEARVCVMALKLARIAGDPPNLRFIIGDARDLAEFFAPGELSRIYLNFPDPWDRRKKWTPRRLTHSSFLALYERICPDCELFLKTDNRILFDFSVSELEKRGWSITSLTRDLAQSGCESDVITEYEEKFLAVGQPIRRLEAGFGKGNAMPIPEGDSRLGSLHDSRKLLRESVMEWDLRDFYEGLDDPALARDMDDFRRYAAEYAAFADSPGQPAEALARYVELSNRYERFERIKLYCRLVQSAGEFSQVQAKITDAGDERARKQEAVFDGINAGLAAPEAAARRYIAAIPDLGGLIASNGTLAEHEFFLREAAAKGAYALGGREEELAARLTTHGAAAFGSLKERLFATLTGGVTIGGETRTMPMNSIRLLSSSSDPNIREAGFNAELAACPQIAETAAAALFGVKGASVALAKARGFESLLDETLFKSRLERGTLESLLAEIRKRLPMFRRYFRAKAKRLGYGGGLKFRDLFAPVAGDRRYTYGDACDLVEKCFARYSAKMAAFARRAYDSRWVDAAPRAGKRGGAFCENIHALGQSRILMTFDGSFDDVLTLAHETGHAYHGDCLAAETYANSGYTMPIAETASTLCETIVCRAAALSDEEDLALTALECELSGAGQVIVDIYSRFLFEDAVVKAAEDGPLSVAELNALMVKCQREAYGDGLAEGSEHPYMWVVKPHYYDEYTHYYNFPYAYGLLFAKGLFALWESEGEGFADKYEKLLGVTGKTTLEDAAASVGIDVRGREFWARAMDSIEKDIARFGKMV
ncbi:MAG: tRNA (guanosine(46)-N7)-methyltransferase TrmB [Clostridiales bacterium]|jgi:tRNA (guanine-N(7)-)-methyltransferase|nr:tRNA (guanosine(46)-N7)-methyltransferase TrmB [Clostridiales bacterium]